MAASLQCKVIYGLKTDIIGNAHYITDSEIVYPVGNVLSIHNISQQQQKLIHLSDKLQINIICVTPNKKYVALCETGEKPSISIYDLHSLKRRKSLGIPYEAHNAIKFNCIGFTFDSKYLAAVTGEPDQMMLFYNWERGKVESSLKVGNPQDASAIVNIIACNPSDAGVMAVGGPHIFKFLTLSDTVWRPYGFSKAENILICSMTWLNSDRLLAGTKDGRILYMENGDLKNIYQMSETTSMHLKIREEYIIHATTSPSVLEEKDYDRWEHDILSLIAFPKGFAYALGPRIIVLFEREGLHKYVKRNIYLIPLQTAKIDTSDLYKVNTIDINISYDRLLVTTGWSQLFYTTLWGPDLNMDPEPKEMSVMGQYLHYGPITDLSICAWKPIFMTCGEIDRSVRIWNFETESLIMFKQYEEDICSIALHPMGLFCLVGFTDKLRFMSILIDDLLPIYEFPIRNCKTVLFCHGGHLFAAVNGNVIQVYTTIGFYNRFLMKGHTARVKGLLWSQMDTKLLSMGEEGAIYEWDMSSGQRTAEIILKNIILYDIVLAADQSYIYCIANDNRIREIREDTVVREFTLMDKDVHYMIMDKNDTFLFVTCLGGIILSLKCPLQLPIEYVDFHIHSSDITKIALSYSEQYLISTAKDGSLCIWKLYYTDGKVVAVDKALVYTDEVLVGKRDLEEKIQMINDLMIRMRELETEHAYKTRQMEGQHNDQMREVHQGYCTAIQELKDKIDKLKEDHTNEINNINVEIVKMKGLHEEAMQQIEINYDAKLIVEYDNYQALEEKNNTMRQHYEKCLADLEKNSADVLQQTIVEYEALVHEKKVQIDEIQEEIEHQTRAQELLMAQIEDDADKEIVDIRTNYENILYEEKQMNLRLKGEAGVLRNRYMAGQKDIEDLKRQVHRVRSEYAQFQKTIQELEKDVADLKKEINERDITIQEKERQIYELKRTNQELEKFKFVLNYKIQELKNQIEPRDQEIRDFREKIHDMETELINLHKTNVSLELQLHELREKLVTARSQIYMEVGEKKKCQRLLRNIQIDLLDAAGLIQEPHALKVAVTNLYHKYSADEEFLRSHKADLDAQCDFMKQRDYLERTVESLKKQVFHTSSENKELDKAIMDNVTLITELNALREELKSAYKHIVDMESLLGLTKKDVKPTEARKKLEKACHGYEQLQTAYQIEMQDCKSLIEALKDDIKKLLNKLPCQEIEK
ncbi:cilia- and flagella-associated protein 57-like [Polistes fuscatus]|uniref:cilia- and flagella-associated protein 57-like n=1 Tax=Polistes fuscatus TaxID=30207 RepID=UPI001CAA1741|nr:cilia- and flagella-associated protein 57-like [Polistes fuscatus]